MIWSDWSKIHAEINNLRNIIFNINFLSNSTDRCKKLFFDRLFLAKTIAVPTVLRKVISISFKGKLTKLVIIKYNLFWKHVT